MKKSIIFFVSLILAFLMTSCNEEKPPVLDPNNPGDAGLGSDTPINVTVNGLDTTSMFTDRDLNQNINEKFTIISLNNGSPTCSDNSVNISNNTIKITKEGYYKINGTMNNGKIIIDSSKDEKITLVLDNVSIVSNDFACIYNIQCGKLFINLVGNNTLTSKNEFVQIDDNGVDGCIFSKDDFTINGIGNLTINSSMHGIVAKDDLKITGGNIKIISEKDGIKANNSLRVTEANLTILSNSDALEISHSTDTSLGYVYFESGSLSVTAYGDAISSTSIVQIDSGDFELKTLGDGSKSQKGIKADSNIIINNANVDINATDDAINSGNIVSISGKVINIKSSDDAIHADTTIQILGGNITIEESYEGLEAKNIEVINGDVKIYSTDDGINASSGTDTSSLGPRPDLDKFSPSANCYIKIIGGNIYINSKGDGMDSNGNIYIDGGVTFIEGPSTSGNSALDFDVIGKITGGVLIAIGSSEMAMNFTEAEQGSILLDLKGNAGNIIEVLDSKSKSIINITTTKAYQSVLISCPDLISGNEYIIKNNSTSQRIVLETNIYGNNFGGMFPGRPRR